MSIDEVQKEIISDFSLLEGDMEMTVFYIMELGQRLPEMPEAYKSDENIVKGCQSKPPLMKIRYTFKPTAIRRLQKAL